MNVWSSRSDIEKYIMKKIVELDKKAETDKLPPPIVLGNIIPDEWLSSNFVILLVPSNSSCEIRFVKRFSPPHNDLKTASQRQAYIYQLQKALLIVVTLLERLYNEKHIIFARTSSNRASGEIKFGSIGDKSLLADEAFPIFYPELIEKLTHIAEVDIVPMSSLVELVERDFKTDSQVAFEVQERRHNEILTTQKKNHAEALDEQQRQHNNLIDQQRNAFNLAVIGIVIAAAGVISTAVTQYQENKVRILNDSISLKVLPNLNTQDSTKANISSVGQDTSIFRVDTTATDSSKNN